MEKSMPGVTGGPANYLLLGLAFGTLAGFLLGAILALQVGTRVIASVRGLWGRRYYAGRVRFELLEQ
jgi:hypothetical protein